MVWHQRSIIGARWLVSSTGSCTTSPRQTSRPPRFWKWLIVYVDDILVFLHLRMLYEEATIILVFLEVIGAPINYR